MSSALVEPSVQADQTVLTFPRNDPGLSDPLTIFTVPLATPARIDAVFALMDSGNQTIDTESLVLFMLKNDGSIIGVYPSPTFIGQGVSLGYVTWSRGNQDSAQFAAYNQTPDDDTPPMFSAPALPDLVLPPNATLALAYNNGADTNSGDMTVRNVTVTWTGGTGPTSVTDSLDTFPLLLPLADS